MQIFLCRHQTGVAQELLQVTNVHSVINAMRCEAVPQLVSGDMPQSRTHCGLRDNSPNVFAPEPILCSTLAARTRLVRKKGLEGDLRAFLCGEFVIPKPDALHNGLSVTVRFAPIPSPDAVPIARHAAFLN